MCGSSSRTWRICWAWLARDPGRPHRRRLGPAGRWPWGVSDGPVAVVLPGAEKAPVAAAGLAVRVGLVADPGAGVAVPVPGTACRPGCRQPVRRDHAVRAERAGAPGLESAVLPAAAAGLGAVRGAVPVVVDPGADAGAALRH